MKITDEERAELKRLRAIKRGQGWDPTGRISWKKSPPGPPTRHTKAIEALCAELGLRRHEFRKAVRKELTYETPEGPLDEDAEDPVSADDFRAPWDEIQRSMTLRPDAFQIVGKELHCYEVVDACRLDADRRCVYADLYFGFDCWDITMRLWVCDVYGNRAEQDLMQWWVDDMLPRLRASRDEQEQPQA